MKIQSDELASYVQGGIPDEEFGDEALRYRDVNIRSIRLFGTFEPGMMAIASVYAWASVHYLLCARALGRARTQAVPSAY